jgi:hypothetical protein
MSASVELFCIDPQRVHEVWPKVEHLVAAAVRRTGLSHSADIEYDTLHGDGLLWLACRGDTIEAAATTVLTETDTTKVCVLTACGGARMRGWLPLLAKIEDYAKAEGCGCLRIYGRKGWARVLTDYRVEHVILRKELR